MLARKPHVGLALVLTLAAFAACAPRPPSQKPAPALRVVVPLQSPPYAFQRGLTGLEVDFAKELAAALGRPLSLRPVRFDEVIPTVGSGGADMAMGGLTVTRAREVQVAFSDPYLRSGLLAVMRPEDASQYRTVESVLRTRGPIGVVGGTTGELFVRERAPNASISVYPTAEAAMDELRQRRVDVVVHDAPVCIWFVSRDSASLAALLKLLNQEQLAWGIRRNDGALLADVNRVLARWRTDGTLDRLLTRWLPYWKRLEGGEAAR